jgi:hypothetical protein
LTNHPLVGFVQATQRTTGMGAGRQCPRRTLPLQQAFDKGEADPEQVGHGALGTDASIEGSDDFLS